MLTTDQTITVFNILSIPYAAVTNAVDGTGHYIGQIQYNNVGVGSARVALLNTLSALDTDTETRLVRYITAYDAVELDTSEVDDSSDGVKYSPIKRKEAIVSVVRNMLNYPTLLEMMNGSRDVIKQQPTLIPVMR